MAENITIYNATERWLAAGHIVVDKVCKLSDLQVGDEFIKNNMLCKITRTSKYLIAYEDIVRNDHYATDVAQLVRKVRWTIL